MRKSGFIINKGKPTKVNVANVQVTFQEKEKSYGSLVKVSPKDFFLERDDAREALRDKLKTSIANSKKWTVKLEDALRVV